MEKEKIEEQEPQENLDGEQESQEKPDETSSDDLDVKALQEELNKNQEELNKKQKEIDGLYSRAKTAEEKIKSLKPDVVSEERPEEGVKALSQNPRDVVRLAKALEGYNDDEVEFIYRNAKDSSINSVIEATKDQWVTDSITTRREKVAKEEKIPESGQVSSDNKKTVVSVEDIEKDEKSHREFFERAMEGGIPQEEGI